MRKFFGILSIALMLLTAPATAFAQNTSNLSSSDKVSVVRIDANGVGTPGAVAVNQLYNGTGIGYSTGTGAGGAVTQGTSRTTAVTLNTYSGQITMFSAAGSATAATFTVNDSKVVSTDTVEIMQASGTNLYTLLVTAVTNGTFNVTFFTTGGTATDAPVLNFTIIHAATS